MNSKIIFFFFIPFLSLVLLLVNLLLASHNPYGEKKSPFECGFHSFFFQNRTEFNISFFIYALLFLLFDLEILLIYPYSVSSNNNSVYGLIIMLIFFILLTLGFGFELGKGALVLESRQILEFKRTLKLKQNNVASVILTSSIGLNTEKTENIPEDSLALEQSLAINEINENATHQNNEMDNILEDSLILRESLVNNNMDESITIDNETNEIDNILEDSLFLRQSLYPDEINENITRETNENIAKETDRIDNILEDSLPLREFSVNNEITDNTANNNESSENEIEADCLNSNPCDDILEDTLSIRQNWMEDLSYKNNSNFIYNNNNQNNSDYSENITFYDNVLPSWTKVESTLSNNNYDFDSITTLNNNLFKSFNCDDISIIFNSTDIPIIYTSLFLGLHIYFEIPALLEFMTNYINEINSNFANNNNNIIRDCVESNLGKIKFHQKSELIYNLTRNFSDPIVFMNVPDMLNPMLENPNIGSYLSARDYNHRGIYINLTIRDYDRAINGAILGVRHLVDYWGNGQLDFFLGHPSPSREIITRYWDRICFLNDDELVRRQQIRVFVRILREYAMYIGSPEVTQTTSSWRSFTINPRHFIIYLNNKIRELENAE